MKRNNPAYKYFAANYIGDVIMGENDRDRNEIFSPDSGMRPEEQSQKLECMIKDMKEELKQLKKIGKHKEKLEKLEREKKKLIDKKLRKHHKHHKHH